MPQLVATSTSVNDVPYRTWLPTETDAPSLSREQFNAVSMNIYNRVNSSDVGRGAWEHVGRWALGTAIDLADSVWSTPLNPMGDRGDVWAMASAEEQEYYQRNKGLIEGSSALAGGVLTAVAAEALVIPRIAATIGGSAAITGSAAWRASRTWNVSTRIGVLNAQRAAAAAGESFSLLGSTAGRNFLANRAVAGAAVATRTLPIDYAVMWNNEAFNSGEWSKEGFWVGVGAALGGAVGAVGARAAVRATANSAEIRDMRSAPFAMAGASNNLLSPDHLADAQKITAQGVQLKESAFTTQYLLASRSANPSGYDEAAENATRLHNLRNTNMNLAKDSMQKIVQKGISGVDTLKGSIKDMPEIENIVKGVAKQDPFVLHGVAEMGLISGSVKDARTSRASFIESLWKQSEVMNKQGNLKEAQRLARLQRTLKNQDDFLLVNGTWLKPDSELAVAIAEHKPDVVLAKVLPTKGAEGVSIGLPGRGKVVLDASLAPRDGRGAAIDIGTLNLKDRLILNEAAGALVRRLTSKDAKTKFKLTDSSAENWFSLDLAAEILDRGGSIEFATKKLALSSIEDIKRESIRLKARAALKEVGPVGRLTEEMRFRYNLPAPLGMERLEDSAGDSFRLWLEGAARDEGTLREVSQALTDSRAIRGIDLLPPNGSPMIRVDGDMLRYNRNERGMWMKPMLGYFDRDSTLRKISDGAHRDATTLRKAESTAVLLKNQTHVGRLTNDLVNMPELKQAMEVTGLHSDQSTGLGGGLSQAASELLPTRFKERDNVTTLAATKIQERAAHHGLANYKEMMDGLKMQDEVTMLTSAGNSAKRAMLDQYASIRSGWDLEDVVPMGDGKYGFRLLDSEGNRRRLGLGADDEWEDGLLMNERLNRPVVVDGDGLRIIQKFNQLTDSLREADNVLRASQGLEPIKRKEFYTPPPDTRGAMVGFVFDLNDKLVPGRTIVANSSDEWNLLHRRTLDELGNGYTIRTKDQMESLRDVWDEVAMDWIDPGMHPATTGIGNQKGGLVGAYVKDGAFTDMLDWVRRKSIAQSQDTVRQLMREPLQIARARGLAERAANPNGGRTIFDVYEQALTGASQNFRETAKLDKFFRAAEKVVDSVLANSAVTVPGRYVVDLAQRIGMNPTDLKGKTTYKAIAKELGNYTPYANVTEFIESRGIRRPPTVKGMATTLNTVAASVLLRWFELPHAAMNLLGLIATIPATVSAGRAPVSTFMNVKGTDVGILDGGRIIADAMKDMFSNRSAVNADWKHMVRMGDSGQSVMEYHQQLSAVQSQAGFMKWAKEADKWASVATDKTENWSRQFAHFVGLRLADYHGIQGMAARHDFAREIANSAIADYAPVNRPELFGSGFGSLFGLFQSYALNQYTKMFRWMEKGQYKQFGTQAAVQATMFGLPGTYGMGTIIDLRDSLFADSGKDPTMVDLIYEHYGPVLGGAIVHGSVSQLSQLAMWSRGDTNFRVPGASGNVPALDVGTKVARGFVDAVSGFMNAMPGEGTHAALEAVQRNMPNRVMRSWLTLLNDGREVDAYGQTMTDTRGFMDTVARTIGLRSARQQSELEAFYASRAGMERDAAKMETLRESFRSAVRRSDGNAAEVNPIQYFNDYVKAGGNPKMFKTWISNLLRDSTDARSAQQLKKSLATPRSALELWRYGAYGAWNVN